MFLRQLTEFQLYEKYEFHWTDMNQNQICLKVFKVIRYTQFHLYVPSGFRDKTHEQFVTIPSTHITHTNFF
jgi:hypothetical protein